MNEDKTGAKDSFIALRMAPEPAQYPVGHQGYHLPRDIELEFEKSGVLTIPRTSAEKLLYELRQLLR